MFKNCVLKVSVDTKKWLKAAGIRAVKTMAQTAVAVIGTGAVISAVDWKMVVSSAGRGRCSKRTYKCSRYSRGYRGQIKSPLFCYAEKAERKKIWKDY